MNLTAHPLVVAAELAWKQESLGRANVHPQRGARRRWQWPRRPRRHPVPVQRHTPRAV
jgi:hypothetical protein